MGLLKHKAVAQADSTQGPTVPAACGDSLRNHPAQEVQKHQVHVN